MLYVAVLTLILSSRELHGALLDAQLLAEVYLELLGGRQHGLGLWQKQRSGIIKINTIHPYTSKGTSRTYQGAQRVFSSARARSV